MSITTTLSFWRFRFSLEIHPFLTFHLKINLKFMYFNWFIVSYDQGRTQGGVGVGVNTPLELDILQKLYFLRKEIKCFRIFFAC